MSSPIDPDAVLAQIPALAWPEVPPRTPWGLVRDRWPLLRAACEAAAVRIARAALGDADATPPPVAVAPSAPNLPAPLAAIAPSSAPAALLYGIASDEVIASIAKAFTEIYMVFGEGGKGSEELSHQWTGLLALIAGVHGEWDLVAMMTGGALPAAVAGDPVFRGNTILLARHLAVVARTRASKHADAAMNELREAIEHAAAESGSGSGSWFRIVVGLVGAQLYFARAAQVPDVPDAIRAWLAGAPLVHELDPLANQIAGGGDVRATIFERYLPELSDQRALAVAEQLLRTDARSAAIDSAAVYRFVARESLPDGWVDRVDPLVAELLGATVDLDRRAQSLLDLKTRARLFRAVSNIPLAVPANLAHALVAHDDSAAMMITGRGLLVGFEPGQIFGDDFRQLGRYLLAARKLDGTPADVDPAWCDFLARRSPRTSRVELSWRDLVLFQRVITHELGRAPLGEVGSALRAAITGRS